MKNLNCNSKLLFCICLFSILSTFLISIQAQILNNKWCYTNEVNAELLNKNQTNPSIFKSANIDCSGYGNSVGYGPNCPNDCDLSTRMPFTGCNDPAIFSIPMVYRVSSGTGCPDNSGTPAPPPTQAELDAMFTLTNDYFACVGLPFQLVKCTNYDQTNLTPGSVVQADGSTVIEPLGCDFSTVAVTDIPNVMNVYLFQDTGNGTGCNGFAYFPGGPEQILMSNSCYDFIANYTCGDTDLAFGQVFVHEVGHYLGLYHTHDTGIFSGSGGICDDPATTNDDCSSGDFISDTDEDPDYTGGEIGCTGCMTAGPQQNCSFDSTLPNCGPYGTPNTINNIMSYNIFAGCIIELTDCQKAKMIDALICARGNMSCCDPNIVDSGDANLYMATTSQALCLGDIPNMFSITDLTGGDGNPDNDLSTGCIAWYDAANGGNLLGTGNTYTPPTPTMVGTYTYYFDDDINTCSSTPCNEDIRKSVELVVTVCTNCPSGNSVTDGESSICDGGALTDYNAWKAAIFAANPLDAAQDPNGWGTIEFSNIVAIDGITPPNGIEPDGNHSGSNYSGITNCDIEFSLLIAYLTCDMGTATTNDDTYTTIGNYQLNIFPYPPVLTQDFTNACSLEVTDNCIGMNNTVIEYSTDGGLTWTVGTSVPGPIGNGAIADFRQYVDTALYAANGVNVPDSDNDGNHDCITMLSISASCFAFDAFDPCVCNNDQTANGSGDGTFSETIIVVGEPNINLCVGPNSSGVLNPADNTDITATMPAFVESPAGTYTLAFNHLNAIGYQVELYDCTNNTPINAGLNGNNFSIISNVCYYPIIQINAANQLCTSDAPIDLAMLINDMPDGITSFNGNFAYTSNGGGIVGTQFDPSVGAGMYNITATYTPGNSVGSFTETDDPVCTTSVSFMITVSSPDASYTCPSNNVPQCEGPVALNPVTTGGVWSGSAATFVSNNELNPINMAINVNYELVYTILDANNCEAIQKCNFQVINNCAANGGRF